MTPSPLAPFRRRPAARLSAVRLRAGLPAAAEPARAPRLWFACESLCLAGGTLPPGREQRRRRRRSLALSLGLQLGLGVVFAGALAWGPAPIPEAPGAAGREQFELVPALLQPWPRVPAAAHPAPRRVMSVRTPAVAPVAVAGPTPGPTLPTPVPAVPTPLSALPARARVGAPAPSSPPPPLAPARKVEMGRFGSPAGIMPEPAAAMPVPQLGSFGAAAQGVAAAPDAGAGVRAAGFGTAPARAGGSDPGGAVRAAGFAAGSDPAGGGADGAGTLRLGQFAASEAAAPAAAAGEAAAGPAAFEPPQVLSWPQPVYTPEAAAHRVEGEVVVSVRLAAAGQVEVLRVVRGLGFGLDAAAATAARELKFRPARRRGVAVDWTGEVQIQFRLAY